ncbi:MAG TPA: non-homologous end-joining DNA ligase [Casimicrobiaceae bacterium]|nr:non-homologous end-joining DNA ligase [Casimicrobiaceae bacterium]
MPRSLDRYREMRDFGATPEPSGRAGSSRVHGRPARRDAGGVFVVQKHAASRLHYDLRLEIDGVLASWAVPKVPTMSVGVRRLAVHTEDHPLEYAQFEGNIPEGHYGAGHTEVWDHGKWTPTGDPKVGLDAGRLSFTLSGERLQGRFVLVRMKAHERERAEQWLLIKERDSVDSRSANDANSRERAPTRSKPATSRRKVGGEEALVAGVRISNPHRPVANQGGITKLDVVRYHEAVAAHLLPHIEARPLSLIRCPGGDFERCFFRRHPDDEKDLPSDLTGVPFVRVRNLRELIASIQGGTFEFHSWGSSLTRIDRPDRMTLDLDPDTALDWPTFREACELVRALLDRLELYWFVKTTGGKGIHFVVPLARRHGWDEVKAFAHRLADHLAATFPTLFTENMAKRQRKGRVYVDYLRNAEGATAVSAYSLRARPGLPVSMPIAWEALDQDVRAEDFTIGTVPGILASRRKDPWEGYADVKQSLVKASRLLR